MFSVVLSNAGETRRYSISGLSPSGWEVTVERKGELVRHAFYHDWHRVERLLALFRWEIRELTARGWKPIRN